MNREGHNGWTNYETWCVALWLDNEEPSYRHMLSLVQEAWEEADKGDDGEIVGGQLAEKIKEYINEQRPEEIQGMWSDLLGGALSE